MATILHEIPPNGCDLSLAPQDCGFDPRMHNMVCHIPSTATCIGYATRSGEVRAVIGTTAEIIAELQLHGYRVEVVDEYHDA